MFSVYSNKPSVHDESSFIKRVGFSFNTELFLSFTFVSFFSFGTQEGQPELDLPVLLIFFCVCLILLSVC